MTSQNIFLQQNLKNYIQLIFEIFIMIYKILLDKLLNNNLKFKFEKQFVENLFVKSILFLKRSF